MYISNLKEKNKRERKKKQLTNTCFHEFRESHSCVRSDDMESVVVTWLLFALDAHVVLGKGFLGRSSSHNRKDGAVGRRKSSLESFHDSSTAHTLDFLGKLELV